MSTGSGTSEVSAGSTKFGNYKMYMLIMLMLIFAFDHADRMAFGIVLQSIKTEFDLSDTQLGLMTGIAFALFYSTMGIPLARWADRGNRITVISVTVGLSSLAVSLCGLVTSFAQMLMVRIAVAIGEAGYTPAAHSLIADYFPRAKRPRAVAIFMLGGPLSIVFGYFAAGWINQLYGWRATLLCIGIPGVLLATLAHFTLREPRIHGESETLRNEDENTNSDVRAEKDPRASRLTASAPAIPLSEVLLHLWTIKSFRRIVICWSLLSFFNYGISQWKATFFIRSYGLNTGEIGTWFTIIYGVSGAIGIFLANHLVSKFAASDETQQLRAIAAIYAVFGIASTLVYISTSYHVAFALIAVMAIGGAATSVPLFATIQTLIPENMRATSISTMYLFGNLIGLGLGPIAVGVLSDYFQSWAGNESLRYSLLSVTPGYFICGLLMWRASRTVAADIGDGRQDNDALRRADDSLSSSPLEVRS